MDGTRRLDVVRGRSAGYRAAGVVNVELTEQEFLQFLEELVHRPMRQSARPCAVAVGVWRGVHQPQVAVVAALPEREVVGIAQGLADLPGYPEKIGLEREPAAIVRVLIIVGVDLPLVLVGTGVPPGGILEVAAGVVHPGQGGVVRPCPQLGGAGVGRFLAWPWRGSARIGQVVGIGVGPLAQVELVDVGLIEAWEEVLVGSFLEELHLDGLVGDAGDHDGTSLEEVGVLEHGIEEDIARIDVLSGDHAEDVEVLGTVGQGQFNLHGVVVGVGEDAVLRYVLYRRPLLQRCLLSVYRQYHKKIG